MGSEPRPPSWRSGRAALPARLPRAHGATGASHRARDLRTRPPSLFGTRPPPAPVFCVLVDMCACLPASVCADPRTCRLFFFSSFFFPPVLVVVNLIGIGCAHWPRRRVHWRFKVDPRGCSFGRSLGLLASFGGKKKKNPQTVRPPCFYASPAVPALAPAPPRWLLPPLASFPLVRECSLNFFFPWDACFLGGGWGGVWNPAPQIVWWKLPRRPEVGCCSRFCVGWREVGWWAEFLVPKFPPKSGWQCARGSGGVGPR